MGNKKEAPRTVAGLSFEDVLMLYGRTQVEFEVIKARYQNLLQLLNDPNKLKEIIRDLEKQQKEGNTNGKTDQSSNSPSSPGKRRKR